MNASLIVQLFQQYNTLESNRKNDPIIYRRVSPNTSKYKIFWFAVSEKSQFKNLYLLRLTNDGAPDVMVLFAKRLRVLIFAISGLFLDSLVETENSSCSEPIDLHTKHMRSAIPAIEIRQHTELLQFEQIKELLSERRLCRMGQM